MCKDNVYLARDEDFKIVKEFLGYKIDSKNRGYFKYIGSEKRIEIPHVIQGVKMTSYYKMFEGADVEEVVSTNKNIDDMSYMFEGLMSDRLKLYNLDTSNVTNMIGMFYAINLKKLDLYGLNTKKVKYMTGMFKRSNINKLSLSGFDTRNLMDMSRMFASSNIDFIDLTSFNIDKINFKYSMFDDSSINNILVKTKDDLKVFKNNLINISNVIVQDSVGSS